MPAAARSASGNAYRLAAVAVVFLAAALRFYHLPFQPGLHYDEAANGFDILGVLQGQHPIFFPENRGREPLFIYWQALFVAALGLSPFTLRLAAAFVGTLTVAATCFAGVQLLSLAGKPDRARRVALLAAAFMATGYWPIALSRIGLRASSLPLFTLVGLGLLLRGLRFGRWRDFVLAGLVLGLGTYTYTSSRLLPVLALVLCLGALAAKLRPGLPARLGLLAVVWGLTFAPLGAYYVRHPELSWSRVDEVSIFNPQHDHDQPLTALALSLQRNARMLALEAASPDAGLFGGRSGFDPVSGVLFWLGLAAVGWRLVGGSRARHQPRPTDESAGPRTGAALSYAFLILWLVVMSVPSVFAIHSPHYLRTVGAQPAVALLMALGADRLLRWGSGLRVSFLRQPAAAWLVALLVLASAALNFRDYFLVWLRSDAAYGGLMAEKVEVARLLGEWTRSQRVFLARLYYQDYTVHLAARDSWGDVQTVDAGAAAVVPGDRPAIYAFPAFDEVQPKQLEQRLGPAARPEVVVGQNGKPLLRVVRVDPGVMGGAPLATVAGLVDVLAAQVEPASVRPGGDLRVRLTWRARGRLPENYSVFVHLRDQSGRTVAQRDDYPGGGSFPTLWWKPGDTVLDEYVLAVPPDAAPGEYRVVAGMYRLATLQRLEATVGGKRAEGDELPVGQVRVTR